MIDGHGERKIRWLATLGCGLELLESLVGDFAFHYYTWALSLTRLRTIIAVTQDESLLLFFS